MDTYYTIIAFITGICLGSFANVLIYRIPRGIPFIYGSSFCTACAARIMPYDLIPLLSYVFLKGKCRHCGAPISITYPAVELLAGALALLALNLYGFTLMGVAAFFIFLILLAISFIDAEHMIIPDGLTLCLFALSIFYGILAGEPTVLNRIIGFFIISVPMWALAMLIKDAFGGGDIKLIAVCGFLLGVRLVLLAGFIAVILGGAYGSYVKFIKRDVSAIHIAFGQYICIGVIISLSYGETILRWYFGMFGL